MRFSGSRPTPNAQITIGLEPRGRTEIVRAAKDPVSVPQDPSICSIVERCLCRVAIGEDCYIVTGVSGAQRIVRYGAFLAEWETVCSELLAVAMKEGMV